ncbi:MAG: gliding motility-associated C-terminal domain-containing protein, partial [Flavobacteriales bacterium]|nr:gliding motility-associated C-terminal domain-containing protein [Flavobacteriales bacterium]
QVFDGLTTSKFQVYVTDTALYSVKLFDKFNCESQTNNGTAYIRYKDPIFPQFITSFDSVLCPVDPPILLETIPDGGVFSGKGVGFNGYFHPVNAFEGESYLYYSFLLNCNETDSILIDVSCDVKIYVPNSFTPNNDFINDFLEVRGVNIIDFEFSIYSRWSEQIFYTKDINHYWDGTFKGRLVPTGTYTYTISAYGKDAKMLRLNGHVNVIH